MPVWGTPYVDKLLDIIIPALLAPGNLPCLATAFACEIVIVTNKSLFERIRQSRSFTQLGELCHVRLLPVDDLLCPHYGITLTYALYRGFAGLGAAMTAYYLLFLNSDFVLADGSYATLRRHMEQGERLILAPSYCTVEQAVAGDLRARASDTGGILAIPPRELADIFLRNRHYTVRAKTINQHFFRMHRHDQFYWRVDAHTMLAHQMPISLVCMKPTVMLTEPVSFWDYGITQLACPGVSPKVISDSDDFMMLELRAQEAFEELFYVGRPTPQEIADDLSSYATVDHRSLGRHQLIVHSADIPPVAGEASVKLETFVDDVYRRMSSEPVSFQRHRYWISGKKWYQRFHVKAFASLSRDASNGAQGPVAIKAGNSLDQKILEFIKRMYRLAFGTAPDVTRLHPGWIDFQMLREVLQTLHLNPDAKTLLISAGGPFKAHLPSQLKHVAAVTTPSAILQRGLLPIPSTERFDFCFVELNETSLARCAELIGRLREHLRPEAKCVLFFWNKLGSAFDDRAITKGALQFIDDSAIYSVGTRHTALALRLLERAHDLARRSELRIIPATFLAIAAAGLALWANMTTPSSLTPYLPRWRTSLAIVIE